jgi:hypothetical protein
VSISGAASGGAPRAAPGRGHASLAAAPSLTARLFPPRLTAMATPLEANARALGAPWGAASKEAAVLATQAGQTAALDPLTAARAAISAAAANGPHAARAADHSCHPFVAAARARTDDPWPSAVAAALAPAAAGEDGRAAHRAAVDGVRRALAAAARFGDRLDSKGATLAALQPIEAAWVPAAGAALTLAKDGAADEAECGLRRKERMFEGGEAPASAAPRAPRVRPASAPAPQPARDTGPAPARAARTVAGRALASLAPPRPVRGSGDLRAQVIGNPGTNKRLANGPGKKGSLVALGKSTSARGVAAVAGAPAGAVATGKMDVEGWKARCQGLRKHKSMVPVDPPRHAASADARVGGSSDAGADAGKDEADDGLVVADEAAAKQAEAHEAMKRATNPRYDSMLKAREKERRRAEERLKRRLLEEERAAAAEQKKATAAKKRATGRAAIAAKRKPTPEPPNSGSDRLDDDDDSEVSDEGLTAARRRSRDDIDHGRGAEEHSLAESDLAGGPGALPGAKRRRTHSPRKQGAGLSAKKRPRRASIAADVETDDDDELAGNEDHPHDDAVRPGDGEQPNERAPTAGRSPRASRPPFQPPGANRSTAVLQHQRAAQPDAWRAVGSVDLSVYGPALGSRPQGEGSPADNPAALAQHQRNMESQPAAGHDAVTRALGTYRSHAQGGGDSGRSRVPSAAPVQDAPRPAHARDNAHARPLGAYARPLAAPPIVIDTDAEKVEDTVDDQSVNLDDMFINAMRVSGNQLIREGSDDWNAILAFFHGHDHMCDPSTGRATFTLARAIWNDGTHNHVDRKMQLSLPRRAGEERRWEVINCNAETDY